MKKNIFFIAIIFILASAFTSCKKGDQDPAISLLSRKARLTGDWILTDASYTVTTSGSVTTYDFDNSTGVMTKVYSSNGISYTKNYNYSLEMIYNKDNSYQEIETKNTDEVTTTKGFWYFGDKNKELDVKNKERVIIEVTERHYSDEDGEQWSDYYLGKNNNHVLMMDLSRLANDEIIIDLDQTYNDEDGLVSSVKGTLTFAKKK